jgi:hypothetical protein
MRRGRIVKEFDRSKTNEEEINEELIASNGNGNTKRQD